MKLALDGKPDKLKARLVALCFEQKAGVDFEETFAPIVKWSTVQTLVALVAQNGWKIIHLDVKTAFLNGDLRDEVFMEQPEGSHVPRQETKVYKLTRALYELCQAPRAWYEKIDTYLQSQGLYRNDADYNLYFLRNGTKIVVLILYVDDLLITSNDSEKMAWLKDQLQNRFEMTDL